MFTTKEQLIKQLQALGLQSGDLVMLHAAINTIGQILGGPDQVHQAALACVEPNGTLMMYVGCPPELEIMADHPPSTKDRMFIEHCPAFELTKTRSSRSYGILAEFFRSWPDTVSSKNPAARIAALGAAADWLVADHPLNYGYGPGSPLAKLYEYNGKVLLLGAQTLTILHYAEHIAPIKDKKIVHYQVPYLKDGQRILLELEEYDTDDGIKPWPKDFFSSILKSYLKTYNISAKKVGNADSYLLNAKSLVDFAIDKFIQFSGSYSNT